MDLLDQLSFLKDREYVNIYESHDFGTKLRNVVVSSIIQYGKIHGYKLSSLIDERWNEVKIPKNNQLIIDFYCINDIDDMKCIEWFKNNFKCTGDIKDREIVFKCYNIFGDLIPEKEILY